MMMASFAKEWVRPYYLKWGYSRVFADRYPSEFTRCWEYPACPLDGNLEAWIGEGEGSSDVLFLPAADWHAHFAMALASLGHRCLNPHLAREFPQPYPLSRRAMISPLLPQVFELHVHLPREPIYHRPLTAAKGLRPFRVLDVCQKALVNGSIQLAPSELDTPAPKLPYAAHESAYVDEGAEVGAGTKIWRFSHVMKGARIGERCVIGQNVNIDGGTVIGNNVKIQNNVSVYTGVVVEDDVFLGPSCVLTNVTNPRSQGRMSSRACCGASILTRRRRFPRN